MASSFFIASQRRRHRRTNWHGGRKLHCSTGGGLTPEVTPRRASVEPDKPSAAPLAAPEPTGIFRPNKLATKALSKLGESIEPAPMRRHPSLQSGGQVGPERPVTAPGPRAAQAIHPGPHPINSSQSPKDCLHPDAFPLTLAPFPEPNRVPVTGVATTFPIKLNFDDDN